MNKISCYDSLGNPMDCVYQWDANREIHLSGFAKDLTKTYEVHFGSRRHSQTIDYEPEDIVGGVDGASLRTFIPMQFLEEPDVVSVYLYQIDDETGEAMTVAEARVPVVPRAIPADYASENTIKCQPCPNGLLYQDGVLYLTMDGAVIGTGIDLSAEGE